MDIAKDSRLGLCPSVGILQKLGGMKAFAEYLEGKDNKRISFSEKEVIFFEALIRGATQSAAAKEAGYKGVPVGQLINKCNVNSVLQALEVYKKLKSDRL